MLTIILVIVVTKLVILLAVGVLVWRIMGPELRAPKQQHGMPGVRCIYCGYSPALYHGEEQRWEGDELVLARTYECRECHMPFWHVERVTTHRDTAAR
jgi:hypothetical protein